jgi:hypothetical protein
VEVARSTRIVTVRKRSSHCESTRIDRYRIWNEED